MKPIKALVILGVVVLGITAAFVYLPEPEAATNDAVADQSQSADAPAKDGKRAPAKEKPRLEEKYGFTGPGVPGM